MRTRVRSRLTIRSEGSDFRCGEALGLRWDDVDFDTGTIHIRQQLQRIRGQLLLAPVKTRAGQRGLPLLDDVR